MIGSWCAKLGVAIMCCTSWLSEEMKNNRSIETATVTSNTVPTLQLKACQVHLLTHPLRAHRWCLGHGPPQPALLPAALAAMRAAALAAAAVAGMVASLALVAPVKIR